MTYQPVDVDNILQAVAAWERAELVPYDAGFVSYTHYPAQTDLSTLTPPYTIHVLTGGGLAGGDGKMTIGDTAIDISLSYTWETYLVLGNDINDMSSAQAVASQWAKKYMLAHFKHRRLSGLLAAPYDGQLLSADSALGSNWAFGAMDVFGSGLVGIQWKAMVSTRETITVG